MEAKNFQLSDGRNLAYAEYGQPEGIPVFFFHGTPGAHIMPEGDIAMAVRHNLRIIATARPGFGLSDFKPGRILLDWPDDVVELADFLKIPQFGVIGHSGGGPHAAACAYKIPERLTRASLVSSLAPCDAFGECPEPPPLAEREAYYADYAQSVKADGDAWFTNVLPRVGEMDRSRARELKSFYIESSQESLRNGWRGYLHEMEILYFHPWQFSPAEIRAKVHIFHGEADPGVPVSHGRYLAEQIPHAEATYFPGIGHQMPEACWDVIFESFGAS